VIDASGITLRRLTDALNAGGGVTPHAIDGPTHTASGLTPGWFLKALTAATFGFAALGAGDIQSGQLALARGGTGADLSGTGGAGYVVRQNTVGGAFTVSGLTAADVAAGTFPGASTGYTIESTATFPLTIQNSTAAGVTALRVLTKDATNQSVIDLGEYDSDYRWAIGRDTATGSESSGVYPKGLYFLWESPGSSVHTIAMILSTVGDLHMANGKMSAVGEVDIYPGQSSVPPFLFTTIPPYTHPSRFGQILQGHLVASNNLWYTSDWGLDDTGTAGYCWRGTVSTPFEVDYFPASAFPAIPTILFTIANSGAANFQGHAVSMGALTTNGGLQTFGAPNSGGAGYRLVLVPN
jgi:hypothetical protein